MPTGSPRVDWLGSLNSLKKIDFATLRRSAAWASVALIAVIGVIFAADSETGSQRLQHAFSGQEPARATPVVAQIPAPPPEFERLARRFAETVNSLNAERDTLNDRLASLERNFDDVTGSVKKSAERPAAAPPAVPPMTIFTAIPPVPANSPANWPAPHALSTGKPDLTAPDTTAVAPSESSAPEAAKPGVIADAPTAPVVRIETPGGIPLPPTRAGRETTGSVVEQDSEKLREEHAEARGANQILGVDLGGARSIDALTIHWSGLKAKFGEQLGNLQPVVSIRERKPGVPELRLIAGPIAGTEAATKLCMILVTARAPCRPTQFSGQRLSQR